MNTLLASITEKILSLYPTFTYITHKKANKPVNKYLKETPQIRNAVLAHAIYAVRIASNISVKYMQLMSAQSQIGLCDWRNGSIKI